MRGLNQSYLPEEVHKVPEVWTSTPFIDWHDEPKEKETSRYFRSWLLELPILSAKTVLVDTLIAKKQDRIFRIMLGGTIESSFRRIDIEHINNAMKTDEAISLVAYIKDQPTKLERTFSDLAAKWSHDTALMSSVTQQSMHPAYQRIIGMGPAAIPLILRELQKRPDHWLWALNAITGEDPARPEDNFDEAVMAWLKWGKEKGYI